MNIEQIRSDTPLHKQYTYLNSAAASAPPQSVVDTMVNYLQKTASVGPYLPAFRRETYLQIEEIRGKVAGFIGANRTEIAWAKNGTEAIHFVAGGIPWKPGNEVILTDIEFHSNYVPWMKLQAEEKIRLKVVKTGPNGMISVNKIANMITSRTRLITISHLSNASGALQPIKEICQVAKKHNALTLINASQTLGLVPLNVREIDCDFLAACGRKWLRGPEGSGMLYIRESLIESITPTIIGWGGTTWDFQTDAYSFLPTAGRVEAGSPNVPSILGLGAAIDYAEQIGISAIYSRVKELTSYCVEKLRTIPGISIYGPDNTEDRLAIIPFNVSGLNPERITDFLEDHRIIIEAGTFMANKMLQKYGIDKMARISPHYFNTTEEIDRTVDLIALLLRQEGAKTVNPSA